MIQLPDRNSDAGVEARVLLAECPGPANPSYTIELASEAMQLMDAVLWNRMKNPGPFLARGAKSLAGKGFLLHKTVFGNDFYYQRSRSFEVRHSLRLAVGPASPGRVSRHSLPQHRARTGKETLKRAVSV